MKKELKELENMLKSVNAMKKILKDFKDGRVSDADDFVTIIRAEDLNFTNAFMIGQAFERMRNRASKRERRNLDKLVSRALFDKLISGFDSELTKHHFSKDTKRVEISNKYELDEGISKIKKELYDLGTSKDEIKSIIDEIRDDFENNGCVKVEFMRTKK